MKTVRNFGASMLALAVSFLAVGCGGSSSNITITLTTPGGVLSIDESQTGATTEPVLDFTASVGGDTANKGVTWSLTKNTSCGNSGQGQGDCGTLSNSTPFTVTYTPPSNLSATLSVTLTATSVTDPSVTKTATISVVLPVQFTLTGCNPPNPPLNTVADPCVLPSGSNGVPYVSASNQVTIAFTGGVSPYSIDPANAAPVAPQPPYTLPGCLQMSQSTTATSITISGTPCGFGTTEFTVTVVDNQNNPAAAAPPVSQTFSITIQPPPPLSVLNAPLGPATTNENYSASVTAQGGVPPLTWTITPSSAALPPGIAFNTSTGQFSGVPSPSAVTGSSCTPAQAGKYCFAVQVTDSALIPPTSSHQTAPATPLPLSITVQNPPPLQITTASLPSGVTATGYSGPLRATGGELPYAWSISQGQLPAGLELKNNGDGTATVVGTPIEAGTSNFTVQVTDSEVTPVTKTMAYSISVTANATPSSNNALLQGPYAFFFRGFDKNGLVMITGSFSADGTGNIAGGIANSNRVSGIAIGETVTGTYVIGSDGRGTMELLINFAGQAQLTEDYHIAMKSDGSAYFFEDNSTKTNTDGGFQTHGEGTLKPQSGAFSDASLSGNYAFLLYGVDSSNKRAALGGVVHANGASETLLPGTSDFNDAGTFDGTSGLPGTITGTFGAISGSQGEAAFTSSSLPPSNQTINLIFQFVTPSDIYFMECDSSSTTTCGAGTPALDRLGGEMILQQPNVVFGESVLNGSSVASGTALNGSNSDVFAGLLATTTCDGATPITFSYDENNGGMVSSPSLTGTCTMALNGTGRAAFSFTGATTGHLAVAYLTGSGEGFVLGNDSVVTTGFFDPQSGGPTFSDASVVGSYALATPVVVETAMKNVVGQTVGNGVVAPNLTGVVDEIDPPATGAPSLDQPLTANFTVAANGRATLTTTGTVPSGFPSTAVFYVVSPGILRMISTDSSDTHPNLFLLDH